MDAEVLDALTAALLERTNHGIDLQTAKGFLEAACYDVDAAFSLWRDCGGTTQATSAAPQSASGCHHLEQLDYRTWKIVEDDGHGQFPFLYVLKGLDKIVVIDTGCGHGNIKQYISNNINPNKLPYLVICTHVHFDHVGGNHWFHETDDCDGILMGNRDPKYTKNYGLVSLAQHPCCKVKDFMVTRWLNEDDIIEFKDERGEDIKLRVIETPGHTLDSISVLDMQANRMFVGDLFYPFTAIGLSAVGSSPKEYLQSINKLKSIAEKDEEIQNDPSKRLKFACGHVEANLVPAMTALRKIQNSLELIRAGALPPRRIIEGDVGEYDTGEFSYMIPLNTTWE